MSRCCLIILHVLSLNAVFVEGVFNEMDVLFESISSIASVVIRVGMTG